MVSTSGARYFEPIYKEGHPIQNFVQGYFYLEGISNGRRFKEIRKDDVLAYELQAESASPTPIAAYIRTALKILSWVTIVLPVGIFLLHSLITPKDKASVPIVHPAFVPVSPKKIDPLPSPKLDVVATPPESIGELQAPEHDDVVPTLEATAPDEQSTEEVPPSPDRTPTLDPQFFAAPASITFAPSPKYLKQFQAHYQGIKARLANKEGVNIAFDDQKKSITFNHAEKEVKAIFTSESLSHYLPRFFTLNRGSLVSVGADNFELRRSTDFKDKEARLLKKAESFFSAQKGRFVTVDSTLQPGNLVGSLLRNNQGICLGQLDNDTASKRFLMTNMPQLTKLGVKTIFLEFLCYDTAQKWLDDYFNAPLDKPMHPYLKQYLRELDFGHLKGKSLPYADIVIAAKKAGIRVVGLDTTVSSLAGYTDRTGTNEVKSRLIAMNYTAVEIIRKEAGIDKYVALMGFQHVGDNDKVPGVANVLQVPSVVMSDAIGNARASFKANVQHFRSRVKRIGAHLQYPKGVPAKIVQQKAVAPKVYKKAGKVH